MLFPWEILRFFVNVYNLLFIKSASGALLETRQHGYKYQESSGYWQAQRGVLNFAKDSLTKVYLTGLVQFDSAAKLECERDKDL